MELQALEAPPSAINAKFRKRFVRALPTARRQAVIQEYWDIHGREILALKRANVAMMKLVGSLGNVSPDLLFDLLPIASDMRRDAARKTGRAVANLQVMLDKADDLLSSDEPSAVLGAISVHLHLLGSVSALFRVLEASMAQIAAQDVEKISSRRDPGVASAAFTNAITNSAEALAETVDSTLVELSATNRRLERGERRISATLDRIETRQAARS